MSVLSWLGIGIALLAARVPAAAAPFAYVPNHGDATVSVIDTASNQVVATVPVGAQALGAAVNPSLPQAYVTNQLAPNGTVSIIDTNQNVVVSTVSIGKGPSGVAVKLPGDFVYVVNRDAKEVAVMDARTQTVIKTITVDDNPLGIAVSPAGTPAYVANKGNKNVSVIDTATNSVIATVVVGNEPSHVAVSPDGHRVYVTNNSNASVSVIDAATNTIVDTVAVGNLPEGIAVDPTSARVYVANNGPNNVSVIDTATNTVVDTVDVGMTPFELAVRPDGARVFVTNRQDGTVSVIDTAMNSVTATVDVGFSPAGFGQFVLPNLQPPRFGKIARKCQTVLAQKAARYAKTDLGLQGTCQLGIVKAEAAGTGTAAAQAACVAALDTGNPSSKRSRALLSANRAIDKACAPLAPAVINAPCDSRALGFTTTRTCVLGRVGLRVGELIGDQLSATRPVPLSPPAQVCQVAISKAGRRLADRLHASLIKCLVGLLTARDKGKGDAKAALACRRALELGDPKAGASKDRASALASILSKCQGLSPADLGSPCDAAAATIAVTAQCLVDGHARRVEKMVAAEFNDACVMITGAGVGLSHPGVCSGR